MGVGIFQALNITPNLGRRRDSSLKSQEIEMFLLSRKVENCSPLTISSYFYRLYRFLEFIQKPLTEVGKIDVELYLLSLRERQLSPHYVQACYRALKAFYNWMMLEEIIDKSPLQTIKRPKTPKFAKPFLTEEEYHLLMPKTWRIKPILVARGRAWLTLLWTTGCRFSELAGLRLSELDWDNNKIRVMGKGARERYVPFIIDAKKEVYRYIRYRGLDSEWLWLTERGEPMTRNGLAKMTRMMYESVGMKPKDMHHIFRRTWAMRNLRAGVPTKFVQLIGGWERLETLEQYVRAMTSEDALKSVKWT